MNLPVPDTQKHIQTLDQEVLSIDFKHLDTQGRLRAIAVWDVDQLGRPKAPTRSQLKTLDRIDESKETKSKLDNAQIAEPGSKLNSTNAMMVSTGVDDLTLGPCVSC